MIRVAIRKRLSAAFTLETAFEAGGEGTLGILGRSGSGKSMSLKCVAGLETPDEGIIMVNGRVLFDSAAKINVPPQKRRVGYLFQHYALFPRMTVLQNIMAPLNSKKNGSRSAKREKARVLIEQFSLSGLENRLPGEISGGQQQRCALARLLITGPELILLDEPFSALDAELREKMQTEFLGILRAFPHAILVTHSRDEAYKLCREIAVMDNGRIVKQAETKALFAHPETVFAAEITGCKNISPIKRLSGNEVYALSWGLRLTTQDPVDDAVTHIGIRAHDFTLPKDGDTLNTVRLRVSLENEEPFEKAVLFSNKDAQAATEQKELWWKFSKYLHRAIPPKLHIPPANILLLKNN
ncbi:MAG: ABC transporter ATP-binding protein [Spirochaetaceae bacterium]|jgi:molybdate transport system ATP-binding protein|nr:ABC transporter ATP-binding protein [Spirochaetaceae bacterium]